MRVICEQYRDGVPDEHVTEIPRLEGEKYWRAWPDAQGQEESSPEILERKLLGAEYHGWQVERTSATEFHAWKEYEDGDGTPDRPNRKDRYFRIVR